MSKLTSIKVDRYGVGSLVVDGVDLSVSIAPEWTVTSQRNGPVTVEVTLIGMNLEVDAEGAQVEIPEDVAKALEALGWKRPDSADDDGYVGPPLTIDYGQLAAAIVVQA